IVAQYNKPTPVNWSSTLSKNDKIPFGTYILHNQLSDFYNGARVINTNKSLFNIFHSDTLVTGSYIIISKKITLNKFDFEELVKYLGKGNSVFMSAFGWGGYLADSLQIDSHTVYDTNKVSVSFSNKKIKPAFKYTFNHDIANQYFNSLDTAKATVISKNNAGNATLISYKFGNGTLYLCATPAVFSNYSLLTKQGADYAQKALSYLPDTDNVYWDQFQNGDIPEDESPLRVFFGNPALQWAYYISLASIFIFIFYEMKRRQRIIPVIEPLQNSTLEFVTVVGQVYYEKRDNANIAHKKVIYLLEHFREYYRLKTNKLNAEFIETLAKKTGIDIAFITDLVHSIIYIGAQHHVTDHELIRLNKLIEKFYSQTGYNGK
ncbi:MAG TPA: DUF4350 domain-containing protein, partial [Mucilaginibacter sp.]